MLNILRIIAYTIGSVVFGPILAVYLTFYGDLYSLSKTYKILEKISDEWDLLLHFGLFWIGFYSMLSLWIEYKKFKNKPPKLQWWQTETIYQIYIRSFFDSNNDGCGDLRGIIQKLDYIKSLGTNAIWITPMYPSGGKDGGYDISSFTEIDPTLGTMNDFDDLVEEVHKRNMYILLDFIPNHTSNLHKWFQESSKNNDPKNPYRDYYVWYPSEDKINPPNNWVSCFGGSAWTYNETRKAWYLHQFLKEQPDLNYRCPEVKKEVENAMKFWLNEKNVDGFRVDAFRHLFEDRNFEDEPLVENKNGLKNAALEYDDLEHTKTADQTETFELLTEWRKMFDDISRKTNRPRALIVECTSDLKDIGKYYEYNKKPSANFALNFQFCNMNKIVDINSNEIDSSYRPKNVEKLINDYLKCLPKNSWSNWHTGNHDNMRVASRIGEEYVDLANALNFLIGGTSIVYYGEEIGMIDLPKECLKFEECQDEKGKKYGPKEYLERTRDFCRTPFQWTNGKNSGFSSSDKTWLPINPNYKFLNVESQLKEYRSHLKVFKDLVNLRRSPSFQWGSYKTIVVNDQIFSFLRRAYGFPPFLVVMNFSNSSTQVNLLINSDIAPRGYVVYYHEGSSYNPSDYKLEYKVKSPVLTKNVKLNPFDLLILTWAPSE
ncbi:unnamed protein product [Brachionus calyciflorus]|uniref:Glycosyl hydrolase family 13 catalytic domain-containing protein n=1 Tax=Brachionus calyciflorus TaxID=104777 RepID=A0A814F410_9BILA|nr:unnamed protein product [Brachionus calyciflorus]